MVESTIMAKCSILEHILPLRKVCHGKDYHFGRKQYPRTNSAIEESFVMIE